MSKLRKSRGVPWPSFWQVLVMAAAVGGGLLLWSEVRERAQLAESRPRRGKATENLELIERLAKRGPEAVPELLALLSGGDLKIRRLALLGLQRIGPKAGEAAIEAIRERLSDEDSQIRMNALSAFMQIRRNDDEAIVTAARFLADADPEIRELAATRLQPPNAAIVRSVIPLASSNVAAARRLVVQILDKADWRCDDPLVAETLRGLITDPDLDVRADAIAGVAARGACQLDEVREWLRDQDLRIVRSALQAVPLLDANASQVLPELELLVERVVDSEFHLLLEALTSLKIAAQPVVPRLLRRVENGSASEQLHIATTLLEIGGDPQDVARIVTPHVADNALEISRAAARLLARANPEAARCDVLRLIGGIEQDEKSIRPSALYALYGFGPHARDAVPLLTRLAQNPVGWVAFYSVEALGNIGPDAAAAVPVLVSLLSGGRTDWVRDAVVVEALGKIGPESRSALPMFLDIMRQPEPEQQLRNTNGVYIPPFEQVATALGRIGDASEPVIGALRRQLTNGSARARVAALAALAVLDQTGQLLPDFMRSLDDEFDEVRLVSALAIAGGSGNRRAAIEPLTQRLADDNPKVVTAAILAMKEIGVDAKSVVPALRDLVDDPRNIVPNRIRIRRWHIESPLDPMGENLHVLSVAEAARQALTAFQATDVERSDLDLSDFSRDD